MKPPVTEMPPQSEEQRAAIQARQDFLRQQAFNFMNQVRLIKVSLTLAEASEELAPELKKFLMQEFIDCAGIVEVKE